MMKKPAARETDKRVPVALGLMTFVLALLSSQHLTGRSDSAARPPVAMAFAAASPAP